MSQIRLLIVDDSAVMRQAIRRLVQIDASIEVIGEAADGRRAVEQNAALRPDVITMDVNMPVMGGLEALTQIMREAPTRVLVVSASTVEGAEETLQALDAGAIDVLAKPQNEVGHVHLADLSRPLLDKIHAVASANLDAVRPMSGHIPLRPTFPSSAGGDCVIVVGTSTGGPKALQAILPALPADMPAPMLIVQHMPPAFTAQMARRLNATSAIEVREAQDGDELRPGLVLLAPGDRHLLLRDRRHVCLASEPADAPHRPSVDQLFLSAAEVYGQQSVAVVLTGMGRDGFLGAQRLKELGAPIIAQNRETSTIFGMPGAVAELADVVCPLGLMPAAILRALRTLPDSRRGQD